MRFLAYLIIGISLLLALNLGKAQVNTETVLLLEEPVELIVVDEVISFIGDFFEIEELDFVNDSESNVYLLNSSNNQLEAKFSDGGDLEAFYPQDSVIAFYPADSDKLNPSFEGDWKKLDNGQTYITPSDIRITSENGSVRIHYEGPVLKPKNVDLPPIILIVVLIILIIIILAVVFFIHWLRNLY